MNRRTEGPEIWFLTGSQEMYGEQTLRQVAEQSQRIATTLGQSSELPVRLVWRPVLTSDSAIRRVCLEADADDHCIGLITWMHTFSPAKMWITGLSGLRKPLLHLHTQANVDLPWQSIDMDFMNLNQAAHGDREFGFVQTRLGVARKTVVGHVADPAVTARIGAWARAATGRAALGSLRLARFGDNMRDVAVTEGDKVEAQRRFGVSVNTYGVNDLVAAVDSTSDKEVGTLVEEYQETYRLAPELRADGARHDSLRYAARIELGLRGFLDAGGFKAFTTNFEDLGGLRQLPGLAVQRLMADGYGFGGEGTGRPRCCCGPSRRWPQAGPGAPPSWRTTPTTWSPDGSWCSGRTCWRSARASPPARRPARSTRCPSAAGRTRSGWSSTPNRARPWWSAWPTSGTGSGWSPTRSTWSSRRRRCPTCRLPGRSGVPARTCAARRRPG